MIVRALTAGVLGVVLLGSPAIAQSPANAGGGTAGQGYDPNERVCETVSVIGSRLAKKRVCGTKAEMAERRRLDRQEVERAQRSPCMVTKVVNGAYNCSPN